MRRGGTASLRLLVLLLVAGAACALCARADDEALTWNQVQKKHRKAFKTLSLPAHAKLTKEIERRLPGGVVIEAAPFDRLVKGLLAPHAERLALREEVLRSLAHHASPKAGKAIEAALKTLAKEGADRSKRLLAMEAEYAEVYNRGYLESGEGARRTRKAAAVLIPFYRTLLARNRALQDEAVTALAAMKSGDAFAWLGSAARGGKTASLRGAAVEALGRVGGEEARAVLTQAVAKDREARVRSRALAALSAWPIKDMQAAVVAALQDAAWEVRALAVAMCVRGRLVEATEALIVALEKEDGRLRGDIDDALHALVGVRMYADVALWNRWLEENREQVAEQARALADGGAYDEPLGPLEDWPAREGESETEDEKRGGTTAFYGITSYSKRIVFLVDISRSMQDEAQDEPPKVGDAKHPYREPRGRSKMAIARWQLHRAVHDLPEDASFDIVVYSESYKVWKTKMTRAKPRAKKAAHEFIKELVANGTTNIGDSLDKAWELAGAAGEPGDAFPGGLAADTLYLLSDGNPNRGRVNVLSELLRDFVRRNRRARLVVHTIGIGEAAGSSFLEDLAARTGGRYVGFR